MPEGLKWFFLVLLGAFAAAIAISSHGSSSAQTPRPTAPAAPPHHVTEWPNPGVPCCSS
jgi:hypothetical protein